MLFHVSSITLNEASAGRVAAEGCERTIPPLDSDEVAVAATRTPRGLLSRSARVLLLLASMAAFARAEQNGEAVYGGFAFAGNAGDLAANYPYSSKLDRPGGAETSLFEVSLGRFFREKPETVSGVRVKFGVIQKEDPTPVLALAMTDEKVLQETLGGLHKLVVQLGFELLTLDFREMQVVSSIPIYLELIDAQKQEFTESDITSRIANMVTGKDSQLEVALTGKMQKIRIRSKNVSTLQISSVKVGDKALPFLPELLRQKPAIFAQSVAQQFGSLLCAQAGVALLPYARDGLNSRMALRFSDASSMQFKIPSPTFAVALDVKGFKKVMDKKTDAESLWVYGAYLGIKVYEPEFNQVYLETTAKYPVAKVVPASQLTVDEFPVASEALKGAFLTGIELIQKDKNTSEKVLNKCRL